MTKTATTTPSIHNQNATTRSASIKNPPNETTDTLPLDVSILDPLKDFPHVLARLIKHSETTSDNLDILPNHIQNPVECAKYHIQALLQKSRPDTAQPQQPQHTDDNENDPCLTEDEEDALDDGFFLCDLHVVYQKLVAWRRLFPRVKPFYALKCNPDPWVTAVLGLTNTTGFDCASLPEISLARRHVSGRSVIYANPQRAEHDLDAAWQQQGIYVLTLDGPEELYKIRASYATAPKRPRLVLRLLVPDEHSSVPLGEKFGTPPDKIASLVQLAVELRLPIVGVSFHCGSGNHNPESYVQALHLAKQAMDIIDQVQLSLYDKIQSTSPTPDDSSDYIVEKCWLLDMGGGYPGADGAGASRGRFSGDRIASLSDNENAQQPQDTAAHIACAVNPVLDQLFPPHSNSIRLISEPGRYFVEEAFCLCCRIYRVRVEHQPTQPQYHYFIAQGVQGVFKDCLLCQETFVPTPLRLSELEKYQESDKDPLYSSTVHGPSGEDYDTICQVQLPKLVVGDWLIFDCMGAYTLSIAARNGRPTVRYVVGGGHSAGEME